MKQYKISINPELDPIIGDEATYLISMLQNSLDKTKIQNFVNLLKVADQVEH